MKSKHLEKQIERINDEAEGKKISVIVQMQTDDRIDDYVRATTEAIDMRRAVTSARLLVPPAKRELKVGTKGTITAASAKQLEKSDLIAASVFLASGVSPAADLLVSSGTRALGALMESEWLAKVLGKKAPTKKSAKNQPHTPVHFKLSGSAVLEVSKDELTALANSVQNIADIFPNRAVRVPPVAKSTELPPVVV